MVDASLLDPLTAAVCDFQRVGRDGRPARKFVLDVVDDRLAVTLDADATVIELSESKS